MDHAIIPPSQSLVKGGGRACRGKVEMPPLEQSRNVPLQRFHKLHSLLFGKWAAACGGVSQRRAPPFSRPGRKTGPVPRQPPQTLRTELGGVFSLTTGISTFLNY